MNDLINAATVDILAVVIEWIKGLLGCLDKIETNGNTALQLKGRCKVRGDQNGLLYNLVLHELPNSKLKYCHTCDSKKDHTSSNFPKKWNQHDDSATYKDRKAGSLQGVPRESGEWLGKVTTMTLM